MSSKPAATQKNQIVQNDVQASNGSGGRPSRGASNNGTKNNASASNIPPGNGGFPGSANSEPRVISPSNPSGGTASLNQNVISKHQLISSQQEISHKLSGSPGSSPRLSQQQLHRFDLQNSNSGNGRNPASHGIGHAMYTMSDMPAGQLEAMDGMDRSDASSSSFNLSTDAEDSEYETLRRRGVVPIARPRGNVDNSVLSAISAPSPYSGNAEEESLYPSLPIGDIRASTIQQTTPEKGVLTRRQPLPSASNTRQFAPLGSDEDAARIQQPHRTSPTKQPQPSQVPNSRSNVYSVNAEADFDMRGWGVSPSSSSNRDPTSARSSPSKGNPTFSFENAVSPRHKGGNDGFTPRSSGPVDPPASTASHSTASRNLTSPRLRTSDTNGFSTDPDFADFVDFNTFGNNAFAEASKEKKAQFGTNPVAVWREEKKMQDTPDRKAVALVDVSDETPTKELEQKIVASNTSNYAHSSPGGTDNALSELLAQAKNKQRRGHRLRSSRASSSSVNSAPAMTASFLRQHHNLGKYGSNAESNDKSSSEGAASVSEIIQSLEATNQSRLKTGSRASYGHRSVGDAGVVSTARAVKERLREKRRKEREIGSNLNRSSEASSSENSDNEASESWLFDEVTGALGPRGIAADLESLSGRSNRSKESRGNKSHVSRSLRRRQSGSRRAKSSGDSVDSRASRYSHRSTKSFLSQMSEQSRSVANDLLRLEMQLAMVGNMEKQDDISARTGTTGINASGTSTTSVVASSRVNRQSTGGVSPRNPGTTGRSPNHGIPAVSPSINQASRNKIDVLAPPGKLGIILANKADSKGTVVSGVRTSSALVDRIMPGDRIIAIDGEDVSRMTVSEITTIMSRKAEYERTLTVLTIPKHLEQFGGNSDATNLTRRPSSARGFPSRSPPHGHSSSDTYDMTQFGHFRH